MVQIKVWIRFVLFEFKMAQNLAKNPLIWPLTRDLWPNEPKTAFIFVTVHYPTQPCNYQIYGTFTLGDTAITKIVFDLTYDQWPLTFDLQNSENKSLSLGVPLHHPWCMYELWPWRNKQKKFSYHIRTDTNTHTHTHTRVPAFIPFRGPKIRSSEDITLYWNYCGVAALFYMGVMK